jgi:hypothetical protein
MSLFEGMFCYIFIVSLHERLFEGSTLTYLTCIMDNFVFFGDLRGYNTRISSYKEVPCFFHLNFVKEFRAKLGIIIAYPPSLVSSLS